LEGTVKQTLTIVLLATLTLTACAPPPMLMPPTAVPTQLPGRWSNVVALPVGALIRVSTDAGDYLEGKLIAADYSTLELQTRGGARVFPAAQVIRVERLHAYSQSRMRKAFLSAIAGAAATAITMYLFCEATTDGCGWSSLDGRGIGSMALISAGYGAASPGSPGLTIYVRP
jgi:hypothetical protein